VEGSEAWDVIVIGAGAAGLTASLFAGRSGARTLTLETTRDGGRKILISGGGRCNVLPSELAPGRYVTASSPNTLKKVLLSWPLREQRAFFEEDLGIPLSLEAESGKLFPASNRARDVRDALVAAAGEAGVRFAFGSRVTDLAPAVGQGPADGGDPSRLWHVMSGGEELRARTVVIATGGLSVPQTGSDGHGFRMVERLGHTVHDTYPALTPLLADPPIHADLAGVSLPVTLHAPAPGGPLTTAGGFLFTHRGYSGPAVLDVSHIAVRATGAASQPILARWGGIDESVWDEALAPAGSGRLLARLRQHLPARLADRLLAEAGLDPDTSLSRLRREERSRMRELLLRYPLPWTGDEGYRKAEVTGGGVALSEVHPGTLESRVAPGLHLCGEILDAFGPIGGYNFAWAWATGRAAGLAAATAGRTRDQDASSTLNGSDT
jgi:predicted Rossmann fold flavoprotein